MSSSQWDPWGDAFRLRDVVETIFDGNFTQWPRFNATTVLGLAVDVRETDREFTVSASVPGVPPEDVAITVLGDALRIAGERRRPPVAVAPGDGELGGRWLLHERHSGPFDRTIRLPSPVDVDAVTADFKNGVLTVTLPKLDRAQPLTIPVTAIGRSRPDDERDAIDAVIRNQ